jgi:hypothetical protein
MVIIDLTTLLSKLYIIGVLCAISFFLLVARGPVPRYFSILTPIAAVLMLVTGITITLEAYGRKANHLIRAHGLEADFGSSPRPHRYDPIGGIGGGLNWN